MAKDITNPESTTSLEGGTYELLRNRMLNSADQLKERLRTLNIERKEVFGTIETKVVATERITTANNCMPWDMFSIGNKFLFGYNVQMGLKAAVKLEDVFSYFEYKDHSFHELQLGTIFHDAVFLDDFQKLYKYYKDTHFLRFKAVGPFLHLVFRIGKDLADVKTFKWQIAGDKLTYIDNRSDHEYRFPKQHQFQWQRTRREDFREGLHPHISIEDRVFVECVGGDLTIKVEDNTDDGEGIYREDVAHKQQTLEDAEFHYADLGSIIVIKVRPYQEEDRFLVFNEKLKEVRRIDSIEESCVLLPDGHGLIFSDGYYLQSGEYKQFDLGLQHMLFERSITSINGEDYLFVFYNRKEGIYLLLTYNLIAQKAENPIVCHGFTIFENGEMCVFKSDEEPKRHHAIQLWQTPFTGPNFQLEEKGDSELCKIGNKDIVRAMADAQEIINLITREEVYADLYVDVIKKTTDVLDTYYWLNANENHDLEEPLKSIRTHAESAVDEYEKVRKLREHAGQVLQELRKAKDKVLKKAKGSYSSIDTYVVLLGDIRSVRGEIITAKELRYADVSELEAFDEELSTASDTVSTSCIRFLTQEHALAPYEERVATFHTRIEGIEKVIEANELGKEGDQIADQLNLLIDTISNLKISDATQTTQIIEKISIIYGQYNQVKGELTKRRKSLLSGEAKQEFEAKLRLLEQSVSNFIDISETPEHCEDYLTKVVLQIEELEAKFSDFTDFLELIERKREEVYNAFESKKLYLTEQRNKKANQLFQAAERVLNAVKNKAGTLQDKGDVNAYFASDLMVARVRDIGEQLVAQGDVVKADDIDSQLKTIKEDTLRQLRDRQELYTDGENIIKLGSHHFYANKLELELSIINKNDALFFHLTGTDFFEQVESPSLDQLQEVWEQTLPSENTQVYRSEFLAFQVYLVLEGRVEEEGISVSTRQYTELPEADQLNLVRSFMMNRYQEGYVKGIHEWDTHAILGRLIEIGHAAGTLRFSSSVRAYATFMWQSCFSSEKKSELESQIKGAAVIRSVFPSSLDFQGIIQDIEKEVKTKEYLAYKADVDKAQVAQYLFEELSVQDHFSVSSKAAECYHSFLDLLGKKKAKTKFQQSLSQLKEQPSLAVRLIANWLHAFVDEQQVGSYREVVDEVCMLLLYNDFAETRTRQINLSFEIEGMKGTHELVNDGVYAFHLNRFLLKMEAYNREVVPKFNELQTVKKTVTENYRDELRLEEFRPRVLSSFVRNRLIDEVYFPLIGANLAKQMGTAGENKRTDLMGLLLLISPPGYGKTTLMEYIASRLGVIFMKINGPAIGHEVTSLDPQDAPNSASVQELQKLNLSFEMGNNVMIYLDDIQHCNPEFLQKFISMCDAQRKIEGVYKGKSKTYDFRGKKVCVVMAGNPYTESGDKFQIPDMLSNRADIYNLGDVIGDTEAAFNMSYLENCLTSNAALAKMVTKSLKDSYSIFKLAETGSSEGLTFEVKHTSEELQEYTALVKHLVRVRDVILKVNKTYIESAAIAEEYRLEPAFKLQGSYRNMNKIAEKLLPMMNEAEVDTLIFSHYENEAQTLTSDAEANLLKFKQLIGKQSEEDEKRWQFIVEKFQELQRKKGIGQNAMLADGIGNIAESLKGILGKMGE